MRRIVIKFGGSNLKTKEDVAKLIQVIKSYKNPPVIVVSALYGVTDLLFEAIEKVLDNKKHIENLNQQILTKHRQVVDLYIKNSLLAAEVDKNLVGRLEELNNYLHGAHYLGEVPTFVKDRVLSYGERFSSLVLEAIFSSQGIKIKEILPEDLGLITDGVFFNSSVNFAKSETKVKARLNKEAQVVIVPGFYGISQAGKVTLFGRGGTDYTAAAIARCIQAESVDIFKDVSGFMSIDPKLFNDAKNIKNLSYEEAAELSYFGAKILHPRTFEPLIDQDIPLRLYDITKYPGDLKPATVIDNGGIITQNVIKSVTYSDDFGILKLHGPRVGIKPGIMAKVTNGLNEKNINIKSIITAQTCINILLGRDDLIKSYNIIKGLDILTVDEMIYHDQISLIAVVGEGMLKIPGIAAKVFSAVSAHGINVQIISAGASPVATYFIVKIQDKEQALKAIHDDFFIDKQS